MAADEGSPTLPSPPPLVSDPPWLNPFYLLDYYYYYCSFGGRADLKGGRADLKGGRVDLKEAFSGLVWS